MGWLAGFDSPARYSVAPGPHRPCRLVDPVRERRGRRGVAVFRPTGPRSTLPRVSDIPDWWELTLLTLGSYRAWRLVAADDVTAGLRDRLTLAADERRYRERLDRFISCPWCLGFWIILAAWACWLAWPHGTLVVAAPAAASALLGLTQQNLDR